jgi:SAM-dependent methyltransferase
MGNMKQAIFIKRCIKRVVGLPRNAFFARKLRSKGIHPPTTRSALLAQVAETDRVLEIGPFDSPIIRGSHVSYFDVLDTEGLQKRAKELGRNAAGVPPINYVSSTGNLGNIPAVFDVVLSCHAVEHQPDLIKHLNDIQEILRPAGRYMLIVPDKRFTFDYFLPETSVHDIKIAHTEKRTVHSPDAVMAHFLKTTHNRTWLHWIGLHGKPQVSEDQRSFAVKSGMRATAGEYIDVHAWIFNPLSFLTAIKALRESGLISFTTIDIYETEFLEGEFFAILTK